MPTHNRFCRPSSSCRMSSVILGVTLCAVSCRLKNGNHKIKNSKEITFFTGLSLFEKIVLLDESKNGFLNDTPWTHDVNITYTTYGRRPEHAEGRLHVNLRSFVQGENKELV